MRYKSLVELSKENCVLKLNADVKYSVNVLLRLSARQCNGHYRHSLHLYLCKYLSVNQ